MAHCHRELMHEQWRVILDDEFIHAYEHGLVISCCDGQIRRFYPRIFTYSADYPEKYQCIPYFSVLISRLGQGPDGLHKKQGTAPMPKVQDSTIGMPSLRY